MQSKNTSISIPRPMVDPELLELPPIERAPEVLRYSGLLLEYHVSPSGALRRVLRSILLLTILAVAALPVVLILGTIAETLAGIIKNLLFVAFGALLLYVIIKMVMSFKR